MQYVYVKTWRSGFERNGKLCHLLGVAPNLFLPCIVEASLGASNWSPTPSHTLSVYSETLGQNGTVILFLHYSNSGFKPWGVEFFVCGGYERGDKTMIRFW